MMLAPEIIAAVIALMNEKQASRIAWLDYVQACQRAGDTTHERLDIKRNTALERVEHARAHLERTIDMTLGGTK